MRLYEAMPDEVKYALAARALPPRRLADVVADDEGQWYGGMRREYDALARGLYRALFKQDPAAADIFRSRLDQRLAGKSGASRTRRIDWGHE